MRIIEPKIATYLEIDWLPGVEGDSQSGSRGRKPDGGTRCKQPSSGGCRKAKDGG